MNKPNSDGDLPIHFPDMDAEMARLVVHNTPTDSWSIISVKSGGNAAHLAASVRDLPLLREIVEHAGPDCLQVLDETRNTPLSRAVKKRTTMQEDIELEEYIVQVTGSTQILQLDSLELSPFDHACGLENHNLLQLFLSHLPEPPQADEALIRIITQNGTQTEIPHSDVNPFEELLVMLMKAQVLTEDQLHEVTLPKGKAKVRERIIQLLRAGRKKSAHSSVLGKREATEENWFSFSASPPRKNFAT